jgi:hypothetical protein
MVRFFSRVVDHGVQPKAAAGFPQIDSVIS